MQEDISRKSFSVAFNKPADPETTVEASLCLYGKNQDAVEQHAGEFATKHGIVLESDRFQMFIDATITADKDAYDEFEPLLDDLMDQWREI